LRRSLPRLTALARATNGGRPPFPTEVMLRILLIQQLFSLSDEKMEYRHQRTPWYRRWNSRG
jgi:hypothetical protein